MSVQEAFFADPDFVECYSEGPPRFVPGHHDMLRMATMLLSEDTPAYAQELVVGAGGGVQLRHFATAQAARRNNPHVGVSTGVDFLGQSDKNSMKQ